MKPRVGQSPDCLTVPLDELSSSRMWGVIDKRLATRARSARTRRVVLAAVVLAATLLLLFNLRSSDSAKTTTIRGGDVIQTDNQREAVTLPDGSVARLGSKTQLAVRYATEHEVLLQLVQGDVELGVTHRTERSFALLAEGVTVRVRGTKFSVSLQKDAVLQTVSVHVSEGSVEISDDFERPVSLLRAGQTWSSSLPIPTGSPALQFVGTPNTVAEAPQVGGAISAAETPGAAKAVRPEASSVRAEPSATVVGSTTIVSSPLPSAEAMLADAKAARLAHRPSDAAATLDRLRYTYPNDSRAGVAAYELGRLRLGELGDPEGAIEAFRYAVRRSGANSFREDAEAGVIDALTRLGRTGECLKALESFEKRSPNSVHRRRLATACGRR